MREETNGENLQFRSKTVYRFLPELSSGKLKYLLQLISVFTYGSCIEKEGLKGGREGGREGWYAVSSSEYHLLFSGSESDRLTVLNMVTLTVFNKARNGPHFVSV